MPKDAESVGKGLRTAEPPTCMPLWQIEASASAEAGCLLTHILLAPSECANP